MKITLIDIHVTHEGKHYKRIAYGEQPSKWYDDRGDYVKDQEKLEEAYKNIKK